ncbi:MAG TPA: peptidoglycan-binding protein [Caulobacteraceae bacterium]|nr:peptidoglycan-binding protein [Caulobacteraceae bacterium]
MASAPWSVKGIDPKAREIAKDLARRSGMTLGEWLNQMILEERIPDDASPARPAGLSTPGPARSYERFEAPEHPGDEVLRASQALDRLSARIEATERRATLAIGGIDQSVAGLLNRLGTAERELDGLGAQLAATPASGDDEQAEAIQWLTGRLSEAEERTSAAVRGLEASFAQLDQRLAGAEEAERRSTGAIKRMGREVLRMADTLGRRAREAEHRSADAVEQVGGEVARMAQAMEARMERSDEAGARALEKLGGEIARIAERLAERIANAERRSAQAMDDVGEQMARVSDRLQDRQERASTDLSERIRLSEERTARLLDDARERIDQRLAETHKRNAETVVPAPGFGHNAYADPEAGPFGRGRFDAPTTPYIGPDVAPFREDAPPTGSGDLAGPSRVKPEIARFAEDSRIEPGARIFVDDPGPETDPLSLGEPGRERASFDAESPVEPEPRSFGGFSADELLTPGPTREAEDEDGFVAITGETAVATLEAHEVEAEPEPAADLDAAPEAHAEEIGPEPTPLTPLTTRELIEQARAAARAANLSPAEARAGNARKPEGRGGMFGGLGRRPDLKKGRGGSTLTTALFVSGGAAALSVALVGYELVLQKPDGAPPNRVAGAMGLGGPVSAVDGEKPAAGEGGGQPLAAVAMAPTAAAPAAAPTPSAAQIEAGAELYADGVRRIEAKDTSGADVVRKAANLGYAPAQFYLAKLYEAGGAGVKQDADQARGWTERAAEGGDEKAMHNLALYYFEGTGGPKNTTLAARWFRRAADLGLVDSQYNLARLYEEGFGVGQNPAEAYKWYLIAARAGDAESRASAQRLKSQLSPEAQAAAERSAMAFQAQGPQLETTQFAQATVAPVAAGGAADITTAQRGLSRLGYYQGPYDGVNSPALNLAIAAYQRDQGLPSTGALDAVVVQRLSATAQ